MCKVNSSLYSQSLADGHYENGGQTHWIPNTDVYTTEEGLVVTVELAGMRREDLELVVEGQRLLICGQRPDGCRSPGSKFLVMEIHYGAFECVIEVPTGYDLAQARALYQNGFLRVDVPVSTRTPPKPLHVPITEG
ncbi:MAG TPA: Hsp20/alpha crystallin family protein [Candidatus Saccharimonadales bacterium]|jgi:HSP20 family protein|nr:Hsp20/alpha crystallin family protein [Candidatus Saccharimonadales bacterium]